MMVHKPSVFEKTTNDYLAQIAGIDLNAIAQDLGVQVEGDEVIIPVFGRSHRVSESGLFDPSGKRPPFELCVVLSKYLLLCPEVPPTEMEWVAYRDFKDAGPLTGYFAQDVERTIAINFSGNLRGLKKAGKTLGGYTPNIDLSYDMIIQFDFLPNVPLLLLFNDADEEFPATCAVLFQRRAEKYLDAECLAIAGSILATHLR